MLCSLCRVVKNKVITFCGISPSSIVMWKLASRSIKEGFTSKGEDAVTEQRTKEERLECPICWEPFNVFENVPYVLWCGHTICKECLLALHRAVVIKTSGFPLHLPFFVTCPWCNMLSLRLVRNGTIKFPSKNYYLLWMVETMNCSRSDSRRVTSGERDTKERCDGVSNTASDVTRGYLRTGRSLHGYICKSMALVSHLLAKFPLVVMFLLMALYAIPVSAAVLGVYFFVTIALAVPSFVVLYFAFPSLNWLIREISA
ncbi:hypothetical protein F2Q70_00044593 [Brassica cretica]|uniref:RING-type domain-containing protein n=1 Tax=Brassica cretica TaxID=69181 RepID=A0A8S9KQ88_BRACR|nr:hypothetical protein F2Q70_00044593 [Brassica cretica]